MPWPTKKQIEADEVIDVKATLKNLDDKVEKLAKEVSVQIKEDFTNVIKFYWFQVAKRKRKQVTEDMRAAPYGYYKENPKGSGSGLVWTGKLRDGMNDYDYDKIGRTLTVEHSDKEHAEKVRSGTISKHGVDFWAVFMDRFEKNLRKELKSMAGRI